MAKRFGGQQGVWKEYGYDTVGESNLSVFQHEVQKEFLAER